MATRRESEFFEVPPGRYEDGEPLDLGEFGTFDPSVSIFGRDRFYHYDRTTYRDRTDTTPGEAWIDGRWQRVVPSFNDYAHMREVTAAEAARLIAD